MIIDTAALAGVSKIYKRTISIYSQQPQAFIYIYIYIYIILYIYIYIYILIIYIYIYIKLTSSFIGTFSRSGMMLHCLAVAKAL